MPTVGDLLKSAREQQRLTVEQAADATKIKSDHIRALEECQWRAFSAPVYIRGFFRSYATYLKLDPAKAMAELDAELSKTREFSEPPSLIPRPKGPLDFIMLQVSRVRWTLALPIVVTIGVIAALYFGVQSYRAKPRRDPFSQLSPGVYRSASPRTTAADPTLSLPTNPPPARR